MARNELLMENLSVHIRAGKGFEISISKSNSKKNTNTVVGTNELLSVKAF